MATVSVLTAAVTRTGSKYSGFKISRYQFVRLIKNNHLSNLAVGSLG